MAARLPIPGSDDGVWGDVLNEFLGVSHKVDGTLADGTVDTGHIQDNSISASKFDTATQATLSQVVDKAPIASPTFTGVVTVPVPTNATDASTKGYVDTTITAGLSGKEPAIATGTVSQYFRGDKTWQTFPVVPNAEPNLATVGMSGSGATYICDGVADNVQIQQAITAVTAAGGGVVRIFSGTYDIQAMIIIPKDPKLRIEGQYTTKTGYGGTTLQVNSSVTPNLAGIIKEAGTSPANTSNADLSHASQYDRIIFDGQNKADVGLLLLNTDHTVVSNCKFVNVGIGIDGQYNGDVALSDYAGGLRLQECSFMATTTNIQLDSHTQDWITDCWFLGGPTTHVRMISCNKIHFSNNEFNTVSGQILQFDDTASLHCGDINVTGGFMNAGTNKLFWADNRTNASSKGVIVSGVRMVQGTTVRLFQQAKSYQGATYTSASVSGGVITPNFNDQVILLNASGGATPLQLPSAATAINAIWVKAINVTNTASVVPSGTDLIEQAGVFGASFTFAEVNESALFTPDSDRWRVLEDHKPSTLSGGSAESVVEVSSSTYTLGTTTDTLLVNASANAVAVTLPAKSAKSTATRKTLTIKVINATFSVTITAAGSDQIDNVGQTSVVVSDTSSVVFIANTGSRWRTYSGIPTGGLALKTNLAAAIVAKTSSYTLALSDIGSIVTANSASPIVITIPPNSSVAFSIGITIVIARLGAGLVSLAAGAGVTIGSPAGLQLADQYGTCQITKIATDTWLATGRLTP